MIKNLLLFILLSGLALGVSAEPIDTAVMFFNRSGQTVKTLDNADYYMLIMSPIPPDDHYIIQEFYKNGKVKLLGKGAASANSMKTGSVSLDGDCISYFQNGKKSDIVHYDRGYKEGIEEMHYPDGSLYCRIKNIDIHGTYNETPLNLECYDANGTAICTKGNGQWIVYDSEFNNIIKEGAIKNGYMDGDWHGVRKINSDSISYIYKYKNGQLRTSSSFDKAGKEYPFKSEIEPADYWSGPFNFLRTVQSNLTLPRDASGKKMSADNVIVSFTVEKDGHIGKVDMVTPVDPELRDAIAAAFSKCKNWTPRKNYGIPVRARITLGLKYATSTTDRAFKDEIFYGQEQLSD